ncbi:MAG TPA: transcription-repair coupling factor [bacterium]|jgi:transcription-repair coupling factor (superfamily II helicase)|nr:transcription-repair coupling factor [bacterium]
MALTGLLPFLRELSPYTQALAAIRSGRHPWVMGPNAAEKAYLLAALAQDLRLPAEGPILVATTSRENADRLHDDLLSFLPGLEPHLLTLPHWETLPADSAQPSPEVIGERLLALLRLAEGPHPVILAPVGTLIRKVPAPEALQTFRFGLRTTQAADRDQVIDWLAAQGYARADLVERKGEFAVRGGLIDVYPPQADAPLRVEWFGDEIDSIRAFDPVTQRSTHALESAVLLPAVELPGSAALVEYLAPPSLLVFDEPYELKRQADVVYDESSLSWNALTAQAAAIPQLAISSLHGPDDPGREIILRFGGVEAFGGQMKLLARAVEGWQEQGRRIVLATTQPQRMMEIFEDHGVRVTLASMLEPPPEAGEVAAVPAPLSSGFQLDPPRPGSGPATGLVVVSDSEIVGWRRRRRRFRFRDGARLYSWTELEPKDLVVHLHHGIGIYRGIVRLLLGGAERDYLELEYAQGDKLYVPTDQINLVSRYIGVEGQAPKIHRLGGAEWEREKKRVKEATQQLARELLELYAARETAPGHAYSPDTLWQHELEASFEFEETPDQWLAIQDVKRDMETGKPMDRLIAGDVGYGKTEVALRAAFKAVMDGKQVAVLVPTTILAQQHYNVFLSRLAAYPIKVEMLSRFRTPADARRIREELTAGTVDIIIGTHRLLQKDVVFARLGLVIVDEEQRFGVAHKERLKQLRTAVDVLTLTATPIPRTLHMALVGLRDMSIMETPPEARLPIHTEIRPYDEDLVRSAIVRELERGGQVYVVHNRVETIERSARRIRSLVPEAQVTVAHGQMPEAKLEQVMMDFLGGRFQVLVCTTIVEIGLDIPQVNTIVIEDAHMMGLSQLYQLRGRVGRSDRQAYCYLLYPRGAKLTDEAEQRLEAMQEFVELGSGFKLAMRDLEIRGAGNLLGPEQHGQLAAVGFELYTRLLDEAVRELRGQMIEDVPDAAIDLGIDAYLPEKYIEDDGQRMAAYRKLAAARTLDEAQAVAEELTDRFGALPEPAANLVEIVRLRAVAREAGVASITREKGLIAIKPAQPLQLPDDDRLQLIARLRGHAAVTGGVLHLQPVDSRRPRASEPGRRRFADDAEWIREALVALAELARRREPAAVGSPL